MLYYLWHFGHLLYHLKVLNYFEYVSNICYSLVCCRIHNCQNLFKLYWN
jgi:hypothetical protein